MSKTNKQIREEIRIEVKRQFKDKLNEKDKRIAYLEKALAESLELNAKLSEENSVLRDNVSNYKSDTGQIAASLFSMLDRTRGLV